MKYTSVQAAINALNHQPGLVIVPPGTFASTAPIIMLDSGQHLLCSGIGATTLSYTGTNQIDAIVDIGTLPPSATGVTTVSVNNCTISGNTHVKYAIRARGVDRADVSHNSLINVTDAGLYTNFSVVLGMDDIHTSVNEQPGMGGFWGTRSTSPSTAERPKATAAAST